MTQKKIFKRLGGFFMEIDAVRPIKFALI